MDSLQEQFGLIYDQYIEKIYRFVYLKVNSKEAAEDLASKVFLRGWQAYQGQHDKIENQGAFLYQIARNAVIDYYREKGRTRTVSASAVLESADPGAGLYEKAVLSADVELVKNAIQKLKKDHQDIIIWHYLDDMPIREIAGIMEKPEGTVRVMLCRGMKDLRALLN